MSTELFHKIIEDLTEIPENHPFFINLSRINEPLLDKRLQGFYEHIRGTLPSAQCRFWSNGTMLRPGRFEWMSKFKKSTLTISLNAVDESEHKRLMGFGLVRVLPNLDNLHRMKVEGKFSIPVLLVAPFENLEQATRFENYCSSRWPLFKTGVRPFFEWAGDSQRGKEHRASAVAMEKIARQAHHLPCAQWFDLHILASGYATKCCIDETGYAGNEKFDVSRRNVLDIFADGADLRKSLPDRMQIKGCEGCLHLG